jgi:hypothetical protein
MTNISITFQGANWLDIALQMRSALDVKPLPAFDEFPDDVEELAKSLPEPVPEAPVEPLSAPSRTRKTKPAPAPEPEAAKPAPVPPPAPPPAPPAPPPPVRELPPLDVLKGVVTQAVRLAQKKEQGASPKILELLPAFKTKTGLGFVMEATDAHKQALADLIEAAGLAEPVA